MADTTRKRTKPTTQAGRKNTISRLIEAIEKRIEAEAGKATIADFIRLTQLERELEEDEQPVEIKVTWVESQRQSDIER